MEAKKEQLDLFIKSYQKLLKQEKDLLALQEAIQRGEEIGLSAMLFTSQKAYPLHKLSGTSIQDVYQDFSEEIPAYITYLIQRNQAKMADLLNKFEIRMEKSVEFISSEETTDLTEDNSIDKTTELTAHEELKDYTVNFLSRLLNSSVINPIDYFDSLPEGLQNKVSLADVHVVLRELVAEDVLEIIHYAHCYKCDTKYSQYYHSLPREVVCENCGKDIVNIEIHYRKVAK